MAETAASDAARRILVVDDDRFMRECAKDTLEAEGFAVDLAANGTEALDCYEPLRPNLIILDVQMPILDGLSTCQELRRRYPNDPIPVLIVTASEDPLSVERAFAAGATDFVSKPVQWPLLAHRVRYLLRASLALDELRESQASLQEAQRIARLGSWEWILETHTMRWSDETFRIFGQEPGSVEASEENFWTFIHADDRTRVREALATALQEGKGFSVEHRVTLPSGTVTHVRQQAEILPETWRQPNRISGTIQDMTEQMIAREQIQYLAHYDSLTGLANRRLFHEQLARAIAAAEEKNRCVGLLYLDLDQFKRVNDTLGHGAGDRLLQIVAERLRGCLRARDIVARADDPGSSAEVSRLGGDEFTILLSQISSSEGAGTVARRILASLPEPITIDDYQISCSAGIGISVYPSDGRDAETLVKNADTAMYQAKKRGRNTYEFYSEEMNARSLRKLTLENRLRNAIEHGELELLYQPQVDLRDGSATGMEALLRWEDPELGSVSSREIIPVAEESGLIVPLGRWVMREACTRNRLWQDGGYQKLRVAVNVSILEFGSHQFLQSLLSTLQESGLDPHFLEIELTESTMLQDDEAVVRLLREMRAIGVSVALDDFGTGYSSLSYLTRFPLDVLKLDRCFVRDLGTDPAAAGIAASVISMAHSLDLRVVAEGVEIEAQVEFLREHGCDEMQGFLLAPPLNAGEFERFISAEPVWLEKKSSSTGNGSRS
jgi:diguanylate cyclase (GGDEF)-like protein/PAS domain S-box-containing protein